MDTLPKEMLLEIMEYLRYSDLKSFRLVCKKFYEASLAFRIVNRECLLYGGNAYCDGHSIFPAKHNFDDFMEILSATERNFYHFRFAYTGITAGFCEFVEKRAEDILSLQFEQCDIMYDPMNFCKSINECIELRSLKLHDMSCPLVWNRAATISLPDLEIMEISRIPDDMFDLLMDTNVKDLRLYVDYDHLNRVISTRGRLEDLKCVELLHFCTDAQLMNIADKLNLTFICIDGYALTDEAFKYFVKKQRRLKVVHIYNSKFITDESLVAMAENLKDLKELIIEVGEDYIECSVGALNQIINLTPLRRLDCNTAIAYSRLATTVGDVPVSKCLRELCLFGVRKETHVTYIAENFLSLTKLKLTQSDGVTTETLQLICRNLKNLKKLSLKHCERIDVFKNDVPRFAFIANFNNLEKLNLHMNQWLSDSILETYFKLSSLRILKLAYCENLTVKSFEAMPKNFPCLEKLNMGRLKVDNDVLLSTVSLMKCLRELTIGVSEPITNHLLNLLYEHSDSLHRIYFNTDTGHRRFIRSWEDKTFLKSSEWNYD